MSTTHQIITDQGLLIPAALCANAQLGKEVFLEIEPGHIAIRAAQLSAAEAQRRALRYVLLQLGDALAISTPVHTTHSAQQCWQFSVMRAATNETCGELFVSAASGEIIAWQPVNQPQA